MKFVEVKGRIESILTHRKTSQATTFEVTVRNGKVKEEMGRNLSEMKYCVISRSLFTVGAHAEKNRC